MKFNPVPYNVGLIDSLTIYLPLDKIKVIDYKLIEEFKVFYEATGELIDELNPPKPVIIKDNGINFRFNRVIFPPRKDCPAQELIRLTLTSKMLFERYFEGINLDNIPGIIDYINSRKIIKLDLQTALESVCNDIDICINYNLLFEPYQESCYYMKKMVKPTKQDKVSIFPRKQTQKIERNFGLIFGDRDSGSVGSPFCKYYNKTEELLTHSAEFYNRYLFPQLKYGLNIDNIIRKEITIKNHAFKESLRRKHLVSDNNDLKTLKDVLSIKSDQLTKICNIQLKYYYEKKSFKISEDLTPNDRLLSYFIAKLIENGEDRLSIYSALTVFNGKEKVQKSISKKKLDKLLDIILDTDYLSKKIQENSIANEFIRMQELW